MARSGRQLRRPVPGAALGLYGRRNRYQIQAHLPLPEPTSRERTVGEILALLAGTDATL